MTIKELINEWMNISHCYSIKQQTKAKYEYLIRIYINPLLGEKRIEEIDTRDLLFFINNLRVECKNRFNKPLSNSCINSIITILKMVFRYALDYDLMDKDPTIKLKRLKENKSKANSFTKEEQIKIEKYIDSLNDYEYFPIIFILYTGLRIGELLSLTWKDVNLKTRLLTINKTIYRSKVNGKWQRIIGSPKTQTSIRQIPLPQFIVDILKENKKKAHKDSNIFHRNDGRVYDDRILRYRLFSLEKKLKIRRLNFHCLRHTFATRALELNVDIKTLSEILGHANASTTLNIYAHSMLDTKRKAMRKFKRLI